MALTRRSHNGKKCSRIREQNIARPRQIYTGYEALDFVPSEKRVLRTKAVPGR